MLDSRTDATFPAKTDMLRLMPEEENITTLFENLTCFDDPVTRGTIWFNCRENMYDRNISPVVEAAY
ncbi:MAG: hypothetical protein R2727_02060 [Bacteroidales bacterium]